MIEKSEWEIVDTPRPGKGRTVWHLMQALLGNKWRWKLAGIAVLASVALVFLAALSFITFFAVLIGGATVMAISRLKKKFFKADKFSPGRDLMR